MQHGSERVGVQGDDTVVADVGDDPGQRLRVRASALYCEIGSCEERGGRRADRRCLLVIDLDRLRSRVIAGNASMRTVAAGVNPVPSRSFRSAREG